MQLLRQDVRNEGAWLLLAQCVTDEAQRRTCLQRVIALNPANELAQRLLAVLDDRDLSTPTTSEPDDFQPRPFSLVEPIEPHTQPEHGKAVAQPSPDFLPQPFALAISETESAPEPVSASTQAAALPPWMRSPR